MGTYTSLIGAVKIKEDFRELVYHINNHLEEELEKDKEKYLFVKDFFKTKNVDLIPNNNSLPECFFDEDFFKKRVEGDIWYFSSNLKNYEDENTGLTPIESFFNNILANVATDILILEAHCEMNYFISQHYFIEDNNKIIEFVNSIQTEPIGAHDNLFKEEQKDIFKEFKIKNGLFPYSSLNKTIAHNSAEEEKYKELWKKIDEIILDTECENKSKPENFFITYSKK